MPKQRLNLFIFGQINQYRPLIFKASDALRSLLNICSIAFFPTPQGLFGLSSFVHDRAQNQAA